MTALMNVARELAGLFVDDGWLAPAILGVVLLAAAIAAFAAGPSLGAGCALLLGCLGALLANVIEAARL